MRIKIAPLAIAGILLLAIPLAFWQVFAVMKAPLSPYTDFETFDVPGMPGAEYGVATIYLDNTWSDLTYLLNGGTFLFWTVAIILTSAIFVRYWRSS